MATPIILSTGSTSGAGTAGEGRKDLVISETVALSDTEPLNSGASYQWSFEDIPIGSSTVMINATTATPSFVPDITGSYRVKCLVDGVDSSIEVLAVSLAFTGGRIPSFGEETEYDAGGNVKGWHEAMSAFMREVDVRLFSNALFINVQDPKYGAKGDGVTDDTAAIEAAIAAAPNVINLSGGIRTAMAAVIYFPPGEYAVGSEITIPASKNIRFLGTSRNGSILKSTSPDFIFYKDHATGSLRGVEFVNLCFYQGGIRIDEQFRNWALFENILFKDTPAQAIKLQSAGEVIGASGGVVGGYISHCEFENCYQGILCQGDQSDNWTVANCQFTRQHITDIELHTSGWRVRDNAFEQRQSLAGGGVANGQDYPWVQIGNNIGGTISDIIVEGNRFGNEVGGGGTQPPRDILLIGDVGVSDIGHLLDIKIFNNHFHGRGDTGPTADSADTLIRFNIGVTHCQVIGNYFFQYYSQAIKFDHANTHDGHSNVLDMRGFPRTDTLFNREPGQGPVGSWTVRGRDLLAANEYLGLATEQLFNRNDIVDSDASWTKTNCTITKDVIGPNGEANSGFTFSKNAAGTAYVAKNPAVPDGLRPVTCSVWVKKAPGSDVDYVRFYTNKSVHYNSFQHKLKDYWEQIWFTFFPAAAAWTIYLSDGTDTTTTGDFLWADIQAEYGMKPSSYLPSSTVDTRVRQGRALQLGKALIGYGTAAPTSGRYEVGDLWINTLPVSGGNAGWICTAAGSPGTWETWADDIGVGTTTLQTAYDGSGAGIGRTINAASGSVQVVRSDTTTSAFSGYESSASSPADGANQVRSSPMFLWAENLWDTLNTVSDDHDFMMYASGLGGNPTQSWLEVNHRKNGSGFTELARWNDSGQYLIGDGAVGLPGLGFISEPDLGLYRSAANTITATANSSHMLTLGVGYTAHSAGAVGTPSIRGQVDADTGLYWPSANQFAVTVGGLEVQRWSGLLAGGVATTITQPVNTSGSPKALLLIGAAHTTLTASQEVISVDIDLSADIQRNTGAVGTQRAIRILAPTYSFLAASTITDAATLYIEGAPTAGTNSTLTNRYALWVDANGSRFDGPIWGPSSASSSFPAFAFFGAENYGMYLSGGTTLSLTVNGSQALNAQSAQVVSKKTFHIQAGSATTPGLGFEADTGTGIYRDAANQLGFTGGASKLGDWSSANGLRSLTDIVPINSSTVDLGTSSRRWVEIWGEVINLSGSGLQSSAQQSSTTGALPVMNFTQSDVDEPFLKFTGTAAASSLTNSIVDEAEVSTATRQGWVKVEIDDQGNQMTDGDYYIPVYTLA